MSYTIFSKYQHIIMQGLIAFIIFFYIPGVIVLIRNIFRDTYFWQIKEYRVDRVLSSIRYREEPTQRNKLINILQYGLFASSIIFFIQPVNILLIIPVLTFGSYWMEALNTLQSVVLKRLTHPKKSLRNMLVMGISLFILVLPILIPIRFVVNLYENNQISNQISNQVSTINSEQIKFTDFFIQERVVEGQNADIAEIPLVIAVAMIVSFLVLAADLSTSIVVSFGSIITEPISQIKRRQMIASAKAKVNNHKGFKVVAITGSYGKTTTKEILYELIKDNFKTAKTRENFNSPVGIAQEILLSLKNDTEVFIAEMGAYRKGEIENSCNILHPDISMVTAIAPQHLSLFGSLDNIMEAKYEIVENLKDDGLALFNGNNQFCLEMATKSKKRELIYFTTSEADKSSNVKSGKAVKDMEGAVSGYLTATNIYKTDHSYKFQLTYNKTTLPVTVKVTGQHNISNILAAAGVALELGMDLKSIAAKLQVIDLPQIHLVWREGLGNTIILDDGYNSNIDGFKEAVKILNDKKRESKAHRSIIVTKGLIELKNLKKDLYKDLIKIIEDGVNIVISSDQDLLDLININTKNVKGIYAQEPMEFFHAIETNSSENDLILLEGALPPKLLSEIVVK